MKLRISQYNSDVSIWGNIAKLWSVDHSWWKKEYSKNLHMGCFHNATEILHWHLLTRNPKLNLGEWVYQVREHANIGVSGVAIFKRSVK